MEMQVMERIEGKAIGSSNGNSMEFLSPKFHTAMVASLLPSPLESPLDSSAAITLMLSIVSEETGRFIFTPGK